jgi:GDPmannose 4,6-dehydratase
MQWLMLQQDRPDDYVIATGRQHSVRQFITWAAKALGVTLRFEGAGVKEVAVIAAVDGDRAPAMKPGMVVVRIDKRYFRPTEVESLLGDASKARSALGWQPHITCEEMCREMVEHDLVEARRSALLRSNGFSVDLPFD